ncbi:retrovirus-related pol polyprotein from transposon TNT 1-94 [Tanacetum coccineum]
MIGDRSQLTNFVNKFLVTVKFRNDHVAKILGYGDYQIGNVTISRVYYMEGLGHNLFFVGQFCDSNLEVAFRQHTCFIRNLEGVDPLTGSQENNMYTLSFGDMMASSPICLLSKATKTKSKDEAPDFIIKFLKMIQLRLKAPVRRIRTDNGTEFVNQTLRGYYEKDSCPTSSFNTICTHLRTDWDLLFQPLFDELLNPPSSVDHPAPKVIAPIVEAVAPKPDASTGSPSSTTVDEDAQSATLKDIFNTFDQYLIDELIEVQNVFHQMEQAVEQHSLESKMFEVKMNQVLNENKRLLEQVINNDIVNITVNSSVNNAYVNVHECEKCLKLETELLNKKEFIEKDTYDKLFRSYATLEKYCISLEVDTQLNHEIFQRDNFVSNQSAPDLDQYFELNELKAQSQEKDTVISKLKERIKSFSGNMNEDKVKKDIEEIEMINIELDHRVQKSVEISNLNVSLQEKGLVITALKDELRKLKGKDLADNVVTKHTIAPERLKINVEPIAPRLLNNKTVHSDYLRHTQEQAAILREIVEQGKLQNLLNNSLDSACKYTKRIQELLIIIRQTYPSINNSSDKLVVVTPKNKDKSVRFTEPITSLGNTNTKTASSSNLVSNKPILSSTGVKSSTSASGSQPSGNTKKDKIQQIQSSDQKNKVEAHSRTVKSSLKNKNCVMEPNGTSNVKHSKLNATSELLCVKCNGCMLSDNHDLCVFDFINNVNAHDKSNSVKKNSKRKVWKPTGKVFTNIGYTWRPTGRTFTIVGNAYPLTRITTTTKVPCRKPTALETDTPKHVVKLVYLRKPKKSKTNVPVSKPKIIKSISANNKNDHVAKILGYGDYQIGDVTISRVYYVEGLGHNLFSVGQFCYSNLEVAFRQHTCFIRNLKGVDLLTGSRGNNLYTLSLRDMMTSSPICLLHGLFQGLPKLQFEKDHLCSACAMGKSKKKPHKPKSKDTNKEKLYLLHMDLCGLMHVASVNGKKYILVIVAPVQRIRTDNGTEFVNQTLREYYEKVGISHETSVARSSQQNSVVERCNRTLIETARTMLIYAKARYSYGQKQLLPHFQLLFDELFNPPSSVDRPTPEVIAPIAEVVAPEPAESTEENHDLNVAHMNNDPFFGIQIPENDSEASSSSDVIPTIVHTSAPNSEHVTKRTKDHPLDNIIGELERPISTRLQLYEQALFCYYNAFLTSVEPKNYKDALTQARWIEALQEELNEFEHLEVWKLIPHPDKVMVITLN